MVPIFFFTPLYDIPFLVKTEFADFSKDPLLAFSLKHPITYAIVKMWTLPIRPGWPVVWLAGCPTVGGGDGGDGVTAAAPVLLLVLGRFVLAA